ncbi:hypothetical protein ACFL6A_04680, partial [bacterium]
MKDSKGKKKGMGWIIGGIIVAAAVIVYFATLYPPVSDTDVTGTIGGAEKAKKYRSQQISDSDVVLDESRSAESHSMRSWEDRASELEKMPALERSRALGKFTALERALLLERMGAVRRAESLEKMSKVDRTVTLAKMEVLKRAEAL